MLFIIFLVAFIAGPLIYRYGKNKGNQKYKNLGVVLWVVGWGYLIYVVYSLTSWS